MFLSASKSSQGGPPRISQLLPTVKCSNCNQPVPLNELGDHVCSVPPPVPSLPANTTGGFKGRLQGLLSAPAAKPPPTHPIPSPPATPTQPLSPVSPNLPSTPPKASSPPRQPRRPSLASNKTGSTASFQPRSSPLARSFSDDSTEDYFSSKQSDSGLSRSVPGPSTGLHVAGKASVSSFRSALSGKSSSSGGRDSTRDTRISGGSYGNGKRDTVSSVGTARPSFISSPKPQSSQVPMNLPPKSPASPSALSAQRSPTSPSLLSAPKSPSSSPQIPPISPRLPESRTMSPVSPLTALTNSATVSAMSMSMAPSSSAPAALSSTPVVRPSFSSMGRRPEPIDTSRAPSIPNGPISARLPLNNQVPRGPFPPNPNGPDASVLSPGLPHHAMTSPVHHHEPDTKIGGEAGMAGVGRRGFAAAARAALFAANMGAPNGGPLDSRGPFLDIDAAVRSPVSPATPFSASPTSMFLGSAVDKAEGGFFDKFRNKIPGLGLDSETDSSLVEDVSTARAGGSATPRAIPSRQDSSASEASSTSSSSALSLGLAYSRSSKSDSSGRRTQKSLGGSKEDGETSGSEYGLAYADSDSTDYEEDQARNSRLTIKSGRSRNSRNGPTPTPGQRAIGLDRLGERPVSGSVYSDDDEDGGDDDLRNRLQLDSSPLTRKKSTSSVSSASSTSSAAAIAKALGLSKSSKERGVDGYSSMGGPGAPGVARTPSGKSINQAGRNRSATVSTRRSTTSDGPGRARSNTDSGSSSNKPGMEGWMTDGPATPPKRAGIGLRDEGPTSPISPAYYDSSSSSTRGSKLAHRSNTVGVTTPYSRADAAEKMPKLPARSMTERGGHQKNPSISSSTSGASRKRKVRVCVRCDKRIEDGRWISVEPTGEGPQIGRNGEKVERKDKGVLCERCWKNMYLPKCRRCNLPIEKQAVSSSDGQLKGKYHKDCFNCFTCNKPFPDKIFYVYDGRPLCKYHYHEANDSLCAAATCGQPIEGPCIVSHAGDKYHPEHLTCEWSGYPKCEERLNGEYWELDGRMLCEKHAHSSDLGSDWEDDKWDNNNEGRASRAMKRMTRFVDLGALGDLR